MLSEPVKTDVHLKEKCSRLARHPYILEKVKTDKSYESIMT